MSGLGKPPAGYGDFWGHGALGRKRCQSLWENLSDMNYNSLGLSLMGTT